MSKQNCTNITSEDIKKKKQRQLKDMKGNLSDKYSSFSEEDAISELFKDIDSACKNYTDHHNKK